MTGREWEIRLAYPTLPLSLNDRRQHDTRLVRHNRSWRNWRVTCTCGWRSRDLFYDEASRVAAEHRGAGQ